MPAGGFPRPLPGEGIYDPAFVEGLFDHMARSHVLRQVGPPGTLVAVDFSAGMVAGAARRRERLGHAGIDLRREDALATSLPDASVDAVVSSFGLKTLAAEARPALAAEIRRILRPGGRFAVIEVSVPRGPIRLPYMAYLRWGIPLIGVLFAGGSRDYRLLGEYTRRFGDAEPLVPAFEAAGLEASFRSYFHGCATGIVGRRPLRQGPREEGRKEGEGPGQQGAVGVAAVQM